MYHYYYYYYYYYCDCIDCIDMYVGRSSYVHAAGQKVKGAAGGGGLDDGLREVKVDGTEGKVEGGRWIGEGGERGRGRG